MLFKEVSEGYTFVQEKEGDVIKVFDTVGDISDLEPHLLSQVSVKSQKEFEVEISYILQEQLLNKQEYNFYE